MREHSDTWQRAEFDAAAVLAGCDIPSQPPIDVIHLARCLDVAVTIRPMPFSGRLRSRGGHLHIELDRGMGAARRRFTLAHELAHAYLRLQHDCTFDRVQEERYCDAFATSLLLPRAWIEARTQALSEGLRSLRCVAAEAEVSLSAALLRLRTIAHWRSSLLHWRHDMGQWRLFAVTGLPPRQRSMLVTTTAVRAVLNAARAQEAEEQQVWLILAFGHERVRAPAEVSVRFPGAIALVDLHDLSLPSQAARLKGQPPRGLRSAAHDLATVAGANSLERLPKSSIDDAGMSSFG